ncbi:hypothetical protein GCM10009742_30040 [Kribbella karoonensis]|uniref:Low temperature requirement A protein (LtrA) n=1 Tax=Kribbella karoonensis TaxID=324851 RepID=A0ABN2DSI5_9ACTN
MVAVEGLVLIVLGIAQALTVDSSRLVLGLTTTGFFLVYGAGLVFVAVRGLWKAARWSRGPTVFTQLIQLLIAYSLWDGGSKAVAAGLAVLAVAILVCVFQKASTDALTAGDSNDHVL